MQKHQGLNSSFLILRSSFFMVRLQGCGFAALRKSGKTIPQIHCRPSTSFAESNIRICRAFAFAWEMGDQEHAAQASYNLLALCARTAIQS